MVNNKTVPNNYVILQPSVYLKWPFVLNQNRSGFVSLLQYVVVSSKKLLFYNTELDREKANLFMTPDIEWVIKSSVQNCYVHWLSEKYFVYLMMQNTEEMKILSSLKGKSFGICKCVLIPLSFIQKHSQSIQYSFTKCNFV